MDTKIKKAEACITNLDNGISRFVRNGNLAKIHENQNKFTTTMILLLFFSILSIRSKDTPVSTTHRRQQSIPCYFPSLSFCFCIEYASLIGSFYFVVIVFVLFSLSATKLSSNSKLCVMFT